MRFGLGGSFSSSPLQRSGAVRTGGGLSKGPENSRLILLMREPFSALDVQTRGLMQDELLRLWSGDEGTTRGAAVVFVTHDLEEAVVLGDRVVVMTAGPATVKASFDVPLERPRDAEEVRLTAEFLEIYREVWDSLREEVQITRERGAGRAA